MTKCQNDILGTSCSSPLSVAGGARPFIAGAVRIGEEQTKKGDTYSTYLLSLPTPTHPEEEFLLHKFVTENEVIGPFCQ